jgi:uncharacterized membrane protein YsdA (DUF1294 family)
MMIITLPQILAALITVNGIAFLAFWWDKRLAQAGARRISENTLLWLAVLGGTVGAVSAQHIFRHKTRKEPFRTMLYLIAFLQIAGIATWLLAPDIATRLVGLLLA